ncbi:Multiple RNA-binding domain-containing protein 1 [Saitozyma podzolica]|uniref:Multiple RNA-binding domain-containing protein 1 n=1 Tax=Saitozyma podzolica TaxID=1890683 RepID=A0A427YNU1_9TREE|nr:Multiple RNA-binding domain-containing protein 1 [Saitozyma podzolica]
MPASDRASERPPPEGQAGGKGARGGNSVPTHLPQPPPDPHPRHLQIPPHHSPNLRSSTTITDTKLVPKRRFAFVGYKTDDEARRVKEWFDGSFSFGGGKVQVEFVRDEPLAAPPAKRSKTKITQTAETTSETTQPEAGPSRQLQEFMDVMKGVDPIASSSKSAITAVPGEEGWVAEGLKGKHDEGKKKSRREKIAEKKSQLELGPGGGNKKGKERSRSPEVEEVDDDAAWLARRRKAALDGEEGDAVDGDGEVEQITATTDPDSQLILSTGRLFVRNLAFVTTAEELSSHFGRFGHIEEVHLPVSQTTGEPLGTAFILFRDPQDALSAYNTLDKTTFQGRLLHVLPGRARPGQERTGAEKIIGGDVLGKTKEGRAEVKGKIDAKRTEQSAKGVNWATMYMNSDAVAASVADRMGISKSELLAGDDGNAAVKLALAETTVIAETKKYFEDAGIVLESLSPRVPRSQTVILVKNIPYGTTVHTLTDLFSPHGDLKRILLPPSGTLGVVEFTHAHEAGKAFKAVAYRRLGNAVLYLEKGPEGMFKDPNVPSLKEKAAEEKRLLAEKVAEAAAAATASSSRDQPDPTDEAGSTLFLKNLSFATTSDRLASVLSSLAGFSFARVQTKPDPKREGARLSMGYGFVGFKTKDAAQRALGGLQGFEIDGYKIEAKFAQRGAEEVDKEHNKGEPIKGKNKGTKVLVKNLPFEATKKDVRELFSAYGQLKSLRLPKKATLSSTGSQGTRGFAFLEFTTHTEAQRAMDALKHTHLLGRHLVMEWAKEGEGVDVDALREKVGRDRRLEGAWGGMLGKRKLDLTAGQNEELHGLEE